MGIDVDSAGRYLGGTLYAGDGERIGTIGQIYLDDATGQPEWVTVATGLFGTKETFVPLVDAAPHEDGLAVPFGKDRVKDAPRVSLDHGHLSQDEEERLYRFYDIAYARDDSDSVLPAAGRDDTAPGAGGTDEDGVSVVRSEERVRVTGTERVPTAKARLRKYVETEYRTVTVPVRTEKVALETDPVPEEELDAAARAAAERQVREEG